MKNNNILITSVGRRVSLVNIFKEELNRYFPEAKLYSVDYSPNLSPAAHISDQYFKICRIDNSEYIDQLLDICLTNDIGLIIPTIDTELLKLAENREYFEKKGIEIVISNSEWINIFASKINTHKFFKDQGISVCEIYSKEQYKLPLFIKPNEGSSSENNFLITSEDDFTKSHFSNDELNFFEYIDSASYDEYTCDLYYDRQGVLKCVIPRLRMKTRGGEVSKGKTIKNNLISVIKQKLNNFEGIRGTITAQFFVSKKDDSVIGIEVNARFGGGFPLSNQAGGHYPKWIIEEYFLNKNLEYMDDWEENLLMLRYDNAVFIKE